MAAEWRDLADLDPAKLYVLPLGIGNAFTDRYFHASLLLIAGCQPVLIDAPAPLRRIMRDRSSASRIAFDVLMVDTLILTHLHGDHCNGVEELAFLKKYMDNGRRPHLYLLPELVGPLWENRLSAAMGGKDRKTGESRILTDFFQVHTIEPGRATRLASGPALRIECYRTRHSVPCAALRITYGSARLGYSADTPFDAQLIDFLAPCDLIIHEVGEAEEVHTPLEKLESLPKELKAKMKLIHIPDELTPEDTTIPILREGAVYEVNPSGNRSSEGSAASDITTAG